MIIADQIDQNLQSAVLCCGEALVLSKDTHPLEYQSASESGS
jgi:hypothetical protein